MKYNVEIAELLESNAEWRREKAAEYPDDADRNNGAADSSEELATQFRNDDTDGDVMAEYAEMFADDNPSVDPYIANEAVSVVVNAIGFGREFSDPEDFLLAVIRQAKGHVAA